jgi:PAS domain S-box-containing protein
MSKDEQAIGTDQLLRSVFESVVDFAIFSTDPDGLVTSWNVGAERLLGYTEQEITSRSADVIFTSTDRENLAPEEERRIATDEGRAEDERWQVRKDGTVFWASGLLMPLERRQGFVKILRDRTEAHLASARLAESEARFRLLATHIPQLVFRSQADGYRTWGSPQWIDYSGLSLPESLGLGWINAVHPDDRSATLSAWRAAVNSGECYIEHRIRRQSDRTYRWHQTRAVPVENLLGEGQTEWVGTMTDIHELRELKERQDVLMAELQHRTRNLLSVVQSIASQTARTSQSLESFSEDFRGRIRSLSRVQGLIAKGDDKADLSDLVAAEIDAHGASHRVSIDGDHVWLPSTSAQAIGLALHELSTNAVKYGAFRSPQGKLNVRWRLHEYDQRTMVVFDWIEKGVDLAEPDNSRRMGYGRELIERALPYQLNAETKFEFGPDGVRCEIRVEADPVNSVQ